MLYELIDEFDPKCLYCGDTCQTSSWGVGAIITNAFLCVKCQELFKIFSKYSGDVIGCSFTCNDILVSHIRESKLFTISKPNYQTHNSTIEVPEFLANFSDKQILYQKLSLYLMFS